MRSRGTFAPSRPALRACACNLRQLVGWLEGDDVHRRQPISSEQSRAGPRKLLRQLLQARLMCCTPVNAPRVSRVGIPEGVEVWLANGSGGRSWAGFRLWRNGCKPRASRRDSLLWMSSLNLPTPCIRTHYVSVMR